MGRDAGQAITALRQLIAQETDAVRRGAFADLAVLATRKETLIDGLPEMSGAPDMRALRDLRTICETNARHLEAALRGIAAARARLAAIRRAGTRLDTYDSAGRARSVNLAGGAVERRA